MFKVALKNLLGHKFRALFTAVAIALGVGFMAGTFVLTDTVAASFDTIFTEATKGIDAVVRAEAPYEAQAIDGGTQRPDIDPALADQVKQVDGVADAQPVVFLPGTVLDQSGDPVSNTGAPAFATNWTGNPNIDIFTVEEGRAPAGPTEAVVDSLTADAGNFRIGDRISLQSIKGLIDLELVGIIKFGDSGNLGGASFVMMETQAALENFTLDGKVQSVSVVAEPGITETEIVRHIGDELPEGMEVITAAESAEEQEESIGAFVNAFRVVLNAFAAIALLAGGFLIYNTFGIIIGQRVRELALLRSLGSSRRQILSSVMAESAVIGFFASILGLLGGIGLAVLLQTLLATTGLGEAGALPVIAPRTIVVSLVVGTVLAVLCALVPAWRASRVAPLAALRESSTDDPRHSPVRLAIGLAFLLGGIALLVTGATGSGNDAILQAALGTVVVFTAVVVLGPFIVPPLTGFLGLPLRPFGVPGALGRDNARRNPKRSAGTAAALMLSVTLITFIAVFALSFGKSINAATDEYFLGDIEVIGSGFALPTLRPETVDNLAEQPEVGAVTGVQRGIVQIDGDVRPIYAVRFPDVLDVYDLGEVQGDLAALTPEQIAIDDRTAEEEGWDIGTEIPVTYPDGQPTTVTVGAVYESGGIVAQNSDGRFLFSEQVFRERFPDLAQFVNRIDITAADGVSVEDLRVAAEAETADIPGLAVRDVDQIKDANNSQLAFTLAIFFALLGLALIIGALGVTITLALSVFERTREIGLLRAVGATRSQMAWAICGESIILTLLGTVTGLVIGIAGGVAIVRTQRGELGTLRISVSPSFVVGVLILAVVIGVAASLIPAWRAARLNVLEAVTVE